MRTERIINLINDLRPGECVGFRNIENRAVVLVGRDKNKWMVGIGECFAKTDLVSAIEAVSQIEPNMSWPIWA